MSWLLFLDESGHDHKNCPYEVRGGIAVHASKLWPLVQRLQAAELSAFGGNLREYSKEYKGSKLLDKDRFKWASQADWMPDAARRKHLRAEPIWGWTSVKKEKEIKAAGPPPKKPPSDSISDLNNSIPLLPIGVSVALDTLAVRLTLTLAACVEDFHLQERAPCPSTTKKAGNAICRPKMHAATHGVTRGTRGPKPVPLSTYA